MAQFFGFWESGFDTFVFDQRGDHIAEHGPFVFRGAAELSELGKPFSHDIVGEGRWKSVWCRCSMI